MPICAAADRLKREVKQFGCPPQFPQPKEPEPEKLIEAVQIDDAKKDDASSSAAAKKKGGKGKVAAKASTQSYQWNILKEMGVPESEIAQFQDAKHWLNYFPPIATVDLKKFGLSADFRRSFITTDINPYYDSFIRWHFNTLRRRDKIAFGGRLSIFSPLDNQTCADHDRAEGEGVDLVEYTLIKLNLCEPYPATITAALGDKFAGHKVILPAATLRPETMYGQTNWSGRQMSTGLGGRERAVMGFSAQRRSLNSSSLFAFFFLFSFFFSWVLPDGEYGIFEINDKEVFVCSPKSALNMAYQHLSPERGQVSQIGKVSGSELLGCAVTAPHAKYEKLYCLPLTTIKMDKVRFDTHARRHKWTTVHAD